MTRPDRTTGGRLLDYIRSIPTFYRAAKRAQPAYLGWLSLRASVARALLAAPWVARLVENPTRTAAATRLSADEGEGARAGLRAIPLQPDTRAQRVLPPDLRGHPRDVWSKVQHAWSGAGTIYTLADGRVWGRDGAIVSRDRRLVGDVSPVIRLRAEAHPMFSRPIIGKPRRLDGRLGVVTGPSPDNVSHWLFGVLPRISLLTQWDPGLAKTDWILSPAPRAAFHVECLRRFGVPPAKIVAAQAGTFIEAREMVVPSFVSPAYVAPSWFLSDLRRRFDDVAPARATPRIYVSRRDALGRRVTNEDAVAAMLASRSFEIVQLERLSFPDQVALFKGAEVIVAPHGAGLSHLAFAQRGAGVVELFSPSYVNPMYWCIADELGLRYRCCIGKPAGEAEKDLVRDDLTVDIDALESIVRSLP